MKVDSEHDDWIAKITDALWSLRAEGLRKTEKQSRDPEAETRNGLRAKLER